MDIYQVLGIKAIQGWPVALGSQDGRQRGRCRLSSGGYHFLRIAVMKIKNYIEISIGYLENVKISDRLKRCGTPYNGKDDKTKKAHQNPSESPF